MKALIISVIFQVICIQAKPQASTISELFRKVDSASRKITNGQFKLNESYTKVSVGEDSTKRLDSYDFYFKENPLDTLVGYKILSLGSSGLQQLYNGNECLRLTSWNRTLEIAPVSMNTKTVKELMYHAYTFPLFKSINSTFQVTVKNKKTDRWILFPNKMIYNGQSCYKINEPGYISQNRKSFVSYYVSTDNFLPVGQSITIENVIANAKEIQTFESWIMDFNPNGGIRDQQFNKEFLAEYDKEITVNENAPVTTINKLLKNGSVSPDWELPLISGKSLKLSDLKGKIVILDFWYKACAPCQKQMIDLQKLHDKFDPNKVVFVAVNTKDDPMKDKLALFLKNRALTMKSVYKGGQIEDLYNVYVSPALFIINGNREIVFSQDGYSTTLIKDVSDQIKKLL